MILNAQFLKNKATEFLKTEFEKAGFKKAILGISGGIDSAVVAILAAEVLGKENVIGLKLPYKKSSPASVNDAEELIRKVGIKSKLINITPAVDAFYDMLGRDISPLRLGNICARIRMTTLFDIGQKEDALVLGTSNRSELLLGYGTLFGDLASIFNPLAPMYKTQVREVAKIIGVPQSIIDKAPTADLEDGQTDEKDFGFTYETADLVLERLYDGVKPEDQHSQIFVDTKTVEKIKNKVEKNKFKSNIPVFMKF